MSGTLRAQLLQIEIHSTDAVRDAALATLAAVEAEIDAARDGYSEGRSEQARTRAYRLDVRERLQRLRASLGEPSAPQDDRCDGRYPVPQTAPPRDEPFDVTYRCGRLTGHDGPCGPPVDVDLMDAADALEAAGPIDATCSIELRDDLIVGGPTALTPSPAVPLDVELREDADTLHAYATGLHEDVLEGIVQRMRAHADALMTARAVPRAGEPEVYVGDDGDGFLVTIPQLEEEITVLKSQLASLTRAREELRVWNDDAQTAMKTIGAKALNAGFTGDGLIDGVEWLIDQLLTAQRAREEAEQAAKAVAQQLADAEREHAGHALKLRTYENSHHPNQALVDDIERFRLEAERAFKLERQLTRKAAQLAEAEQERDEVGNTLADVRLRLIVDQREHHEQLAEVRAIVDAATIDARIDREPEVVMALEHLLAKLTALAADPPAPQGDGKAQP